MTARVSVQLAGVADASEGTVSVKVAAPRVDMASPSASARRLESVFLVRRRPNDVGVVDMWVPHLPSGECLPGR